jgi:hypothetical protein
MVRIITTAVIEKLSTMTDEMVEMLNAGCLLSVGVPFSCLTPPGTVVDVAKATVAMSAAMIEHDSEVLFSHARTAFFDKVLVGFSE